MRLDSGGAARRSSFGRWADRALPLVTRRAAAGARCSNISPVDSSEKFGGHWSSGAAIEADPNRRCTKAGRVGRESAQGGGDRGAGAIYI